MRTYSKRHRRNESAANAQLVQEHSVHPGSETPQKKRKKISAMSGKFETPHPTLGASSQVYKLPSTKPLPSSTPLSPVPFTSRSLDLQSRASFVETSTAGLKENDGSNKSQYLSSKLFKKSKLKSNLIINGPVERHSSKSRQTPFSRLKSFAKRNKSMDVGRSMLGSPFASRAPSPENCAPNIANPTAAQIVTQPASVDHSDVVLADLNTHARTRNQSNRSKSARTSNILSSPEESGRKKRLAGFSRGKTDENNFTWKNRRPSAPSNIQRPKKLMGKAYIPTEKVEKHKYHTINHTSTASLRLPVPDCYNKQDRDDSDPLVWMKERSSINFNRPPSQVSFHLSGFVRGEDDAEVGGVFLSSGDEDDFSGRLNLRLGTRFTSTPAKKAVVRSPSVPILDASNTLALSRSFGKARSLSMDASKIEAFGDKSDMELTTPLACDSTPWITDSIISPPTTYVDRGPLLDEKDGHAKPEESEPGFKILKPSARPSPLTNLTQEGTLTELASKDFRRSQISGKQEQDSGDTVDKASGAAQSRGSWQRTRSGTILAAKDGASVARRTRTGTIVGPTAAGRTRSGTIVAKVAVPEQTMSVSENWKSGHVISPNADLPLPDTNPAKRTTADFEEKVLPRTENDTELAPSIQEVNEVECCVDSAYFASSPDPINFLTDTRIEGDESGLIVSVGEWRVADEPPSPEVSGTRKTSQTRGRYFHMKGRKTTRTSFLASNREIGSGSDDELLLVEGQSQSLFR